MYSTMLCVLTKTSAFEDKFGTSQESSCQYNHDNDSLFVVVKPAWRPLSTQSTDRHILRGCLQVSSTNNQLAFDLHLSLDRVSVHLHLS